jgi:hypothetical protein
MSDAFTQSAAVKEMAEHWPLIAALLGGTSAMRKACVQNGELLPQWPGEDVDAYNARLKVATLFPAYQRTVEVLTGKPFSKALTIGDDVPARIKAWTENIDLQGRNLHVFAAGLCEEAVGPGFGGILVDFPRAEGLRTAAEEAAAGVRPYFVHVHPQNILGWRSRRVNGAEVLTQLRIKEVVTEEDGEFGEVPVEQVRILYPGRWEIRRKVKSGGRQKEVIHDQGVTTLNKIPFVPFYGKRIDFMRGQPPLLELAYMNVEHWQNKSDQQTILHVARVPILAVIGVDDDKFELTVGASTAIKLPLNGDLKFVEHSGAAIDAGRMSLLDLEDRMRQAGAELLVIKPGNTTEVQTLADNEQGMCALQRIVQNLEDAIDAALQLAAEWIGEKQGGHVTIYKDFGAATLAEASAELLLKTKVAGELSGETLFAEYQRRGILSPDLKYEDEAARIANQAPNFALNTGDPGAAQ